MADRRTFSFDGHGINGPDEFRTRLATFTPAGHAYPNLGALFEAAPDMLEALQAIDARVRGEWDHPALVKFGPLSEDTLYDVNDIMCEARAILQRINPEEKI